MIRDLNDPNTGLPLTPQQIQEKLDEQAAIALHQQLNAQAVAEAAVAHTPTNIRGRLLISVMQAKLVKNYGMTRMDPYVRIHIGHNIYETPTDVNGAKNPRWNKTIQCFLPIGIHQIYLEVYDECSFSVDELIGHAYIQIPEEIFKGETIEEWYNLNGKHGEGKEGQILLVFSFMPTSQAPGVGPNLAYAPPGVGVAYPPAGMTTVNKKHPQVYQSNQPVQTAVPQSLPPRPAFNPDDFKQLKEMFPNMDEEVIRSVYEAGNYNKDSSANALLSMVAD
jgi:toll-interacting protein